MAELDTFDEPDDVSQDISAAATSSLADTLAFQATERARGAGRVGAAREAAGFLAKQSRMLDIQMEHLHEQRSLTLSHLRLRRANEALRVAFQGLIILVGLLVLAGVGLLVVQARAAQSLIVDPFRTSSEMAARGLDGTVLASRLLDKLRQIQNDTESARAASSFTKDFGEEIKVEIPQTGVSVGELERYLRQWLGHDTHISGELFKGWAQAGVKDAGPGDRLVLTVRAGASPGDTVEGRPAELDGLLQQAAEDIVARTQPYRYTVYLERAGRLAAAEAALATLATRGSPQDRAWAYSRWGGLTAHRDLAGGERRERSALALDPDLALARDNLAGQEVLLGHDRSAMAQFAAEATVLSSRRADQLAPAVRQVLLGWSQARLAEYRGDYGAGGRAAHAVQAMADYSGSATAALLNEAATLALRHDVAQAREVLAGGERAPGASTLRETLGWGSTLLPEIAIDRALDDWPRLVADLEAARAAAGDWVFAPVVERTYVAPMMAYARSKLGDPAGAGALIASTPLDCYLCLRVRGLIASGRRDWPAARAWSLAAIRAAPALPFAYDDLGEMLLARGDPAAAARLFGIAHRRGPAFADPLELWGEALMARGDFAGAATRFEAADRLAPRWGRLHIRWGEALAREGRAADARAQWRAAAGMDLSLADRIWLTRAAAR
ncbi:MAG: hypothetical protein ABI376_00040 [Caulobacteraceae bacterium]